LFNKKKIMMIIFLKTFKNFVIINIENELLFVQDDV